MCYSEKNNTLSFLKVENLNKTFFDLSIDADDPGWAYVIFKNT